MQGNFLLLHFFKFPNGITSTLETKTKTKKTVLRKSTSEKLPKPFVVTYEYLIQFTHMLSSYYISYKEQEITFNLVFGNS